MESPSAGRTPLDAPGTPSFSFEASQILSSTPRRRPSDDFLRDSDTESVRDASVPRYAQSRKTGGAIRGDLLDVAAPPSTSSSTLVEDFSPPAGSGEFKGRARAGEGAEETADEETATPFARRQPGTLPSILVSFYTETEDARSLDQPGGSLYRLS
jgi:hypothetical protein